MESITLKEVIIFNDDNLNVMAKMPDESIDVICIDPPYLYLKNQKLERAFNERLFFKECARLLTKNGFIVMFGRGDSFCQWKTLLSNLIEYKEGSVRYGYKVYNEEGFIMNTHKFKDNIFTFKEEVVWDKKRQTSPAMALGRVHENVVIFSKGKGTINRCRIDFLEKHAYEPHKIKEVIYRLSTVFGNRKSFEQLLRYYENGSKEYSNSLEGRGVSLSSENRKSVNRTIQFAIGLEEGKLEQSIIEIGRDHYNTIHPTQKPVRLLERLLALVIPNDKPKEDIVVADFFAGSMSCMEAVINMGMKGIAVEIDQEYFNLGKERILKKINEV